MIDIVHKELCTGCQACANICSRECISMISDLEGFWYPWIDKDRCINCGLCVKVCPLINGTKTVNFVGNQAYACYNKNETIRSESSSGGLFTVFAEAVIDDGGIVFGATFDESFNVVHSYVECKEELSKLRGSKYVQSRISDTYKQAENFLKQGRRVLFTGTPCQISGLKSYLGREYNNLLCQDIICHGVPSPLVWQKYVLFREKRAGAKVQAVSFRSKTKGWQDFSLSMLHENGVNYIDTINNDMFLVAFNKNLYLRPSCYSCAFKKEQREADITLADFWGIQNVIPEMDDNNGISLLIIHSEKGLLAQNQIKGKIVAVQVELEEAIKNNPAMLKSMVVHPYREKFFADLPKSDFNELISKYCTDPLRFRLKRKVQCYVRKLLIQVRLFDKVKKYSKQFRNT